MKSKFLSYLAFAVAGAAIGIAACNLAVTKHSVNAVSPTEERYSCWDTVADNVYHINLSESSCVMLYCADDRCSICPNGITEVDFIQDSNQVPFVFGKSDNCGNRSYTVYYGDLDSTSRYFTAVLDSMEVDIPIMECKHDIEDDLE